MSRDQPPDSDGEQSPRAALAAVAVIVVLLVCGLWLTGLLGRASSVQDCVSAGRSNCAPVATPAS